MELKIMDTMDSIFTALFILSLLLTIHSYVLYPIIIKTISILLKQKVFEQEQIPSISILCSVYNEEKVIRTRIENIYIQNYDHSRIEFILGSDCSNDGTNEILLDMAKKYPWLKIKIFTERGGKASVLNKLAKEAQHSILVFTDANTEFDVDALKYLVSPFCNSKIGGVCGRLVLKESSGNQFESDEEEKYWNYEVSIKKAEGDLGVLIGANGGIFAIRKELYAEIPVKKAVTDDLFLSLTVISKGFWFIFQSKAIAFENISNTVKHEIKRKIRFASTNFQTGLFFNHLLFNKNLLISYSIWSHKIIRWFIPVLLIVIFFSNLLLLNNNLFFKVFFLSQFCFYVFALIGYILSLLKIRILIFSVPYFFVISNGALLIGFFRFLLGKHSVIWQSTPR